VQRRTWASETGVASCLGKEFNSHNAKTALTMVRNTSKTMRLDDKVYFGLGGNLSPYLTYQSDMKPYASRNSGSTWAFKLNRPTS
jgi:hypothetical protein